jgi:predicted GNAT family N-acyltransferase
MRHRGYSIDIVDWKPGNDTALAAIRRAVFVREQGVSEAEEWDGLDPQCVHALARDSNGTPVGCGRLLPDGRIGRMAVLRGWRGCGMGAALLRSLLEVARARGGPRPFLHAQEHAIGFYRRLGFVARGPRFLDAGIAHREMVLACWPRSCG